MTQIKIAENVNVKVFAKGVDKQEQLPFCQHGSFDIIKGSLFSQRLVVTYMIAIFENYYQK